MERSRHKTGNVIILAVLALILGLAVCYGIGFSKGVDYTIDKIISILQDETLLEKVNFYMQKYVFGNQTRIGGIR